MDGRRTDGRTEGYLDGTDAGDTGNCFIPSSDGHVMYILTYTDVSEIDDAQGENARFGLVRFSYFASCIC